MGLLDRCPLDTWHPMENAHAFSRFIQGRVENIDEH